MITFVKISHAHLKAESCSHEAPLNIPQTHFGSNRILPQNHYDKTLEDSTCLGPLPFPSPSQILGGGGNVVPWAKQAS